MSVTQNDNGDLIISIKDFSGLETYTVEAVRILIESQNFLKIKETLQRMGIFSRKDNTLWQSAHILHKRGFYYILHFKELLSMDGKAVNFSSEDEVRRDYIVGLLEKWGLLKIADKKVLLEIRSQLSSGVKPPNLRILPYSSRNEVNLGSKYDIGKPQSQ